MDFKEDGIITIDKIKKKKVKCYKFQYKPLNRYLMLHPDIESAECTTLSDFSSGYRLFKIQTKPDKLTKDYLYEKLEKYVSHFTAEGILEEIEKLQKIEKTLKEKQK